MWGRKGLERPAQSTSAALSRPRQPLTHPHPHSPQWTPSSPSLPSSPLRSPRLRTSSSTRRPAAAARTGRAPSLKRCARLPPLRASSVSVTAFTRQLIHRADHYTPPAQRSTRHDLPIAPVLGLPFTNHPRGHPRPGPLSRALFVLATRLVTPPRHSVAPFVFQMPLSPAVSSHTRFVALFWRCICTHKLSNKLYPLPREKGQREEEGVGKWCI